MKTTLEEEKYRQTIRVSIFEALQICVKEVSSLFRIEKEMNIILKKDGESSAHNP
ncbi:MAG: hypothetical protein HXS48_23350 [Theionarchaea archaeon]|nr:hypothetical protein [Theionarchaea archaeon]